MGMEENLQLMKTLDDAWNSQDWDTFSKRHTNDVIVRWPGQSEPTRGLEIHKREGIEMFKIFPDNHVENNPCKATFWSRGLDLLYCYILRHTQRSYDGPWR